jgi:AraC family transcriptional regulator, regulatory protein of adaptative response / methylated-DNA-[protein]-cysteine methyltransferase
MIDETKSWQAVLSRDNTQDGKFLYGVMTTGVFCRPGCASRAPLRKNVRFYKTAEEAEADGLRPCLRCKPSRGKSDARMDRIAEMRKFIRNHLENHALLKLEALSRHFGLSPFHLQRTFKAAVGMTPKKYVEELRVQTFKEDLRSGTTVTNAVYDAGFGSSSRVYERVDTKLGMTPKQYRGGGKGVEISYAAVDTPLGLIMIGATDRGLCFLEFGRHESELLDSLHHEYPAAHIGPLSKPYSEQYLKWVEALSSYLEGEKALGKLPVSLHGTAFQVKVWNYLQTIPDGSVQSYSEVAEAIGHPKATRAVASACAANRIALVVPCHRVIRGDGGLGGYRWGLDRKRALLDTERGVQTRTS